MLVYFFIFSVSGQRVNLLYQPVPCISRLPIRSRTRVIFISHEESHKSRKSYLKLLAGCHIRGYSRNTVPQNTRNNTSTDKSVAESLEHESVGFQNNNAGVQTLFRFTGYAGIPDTETIIQRWIVAEVRGTETTGGCDVY